MLCRGCYPQFGEKPVIFLEKNALNRENVLFVGFIQEFLQKAQKTKMKRLQLTFSAVFVSL